MQPSEEIKSKLDIVDVIREYINLTPAGVNFKARCPFHNEKTPSFIVSPDKQIWHCFGCAKGGDIFSFIMEMEGLTFVEVLRLLAPKAGVELKKQDPKNFSRRNRILDILELASGYYREAFLRSKQSELAQNYLKNRGLAENTLKEWRIGFSPESWDDVLLFLKNKGYNDSEIFLAGISARKEQTNRYYNRFRKRIMFPINDTNGNVVGFSARILPEDETTESMGKYINSPQTPVYDKSKVVFGLDRAKLEIKKNDLGIIVEGQMDVISAHEAGFKNVVATSGTALTKEQVALLKRYSSNIALAFDADEAGVQAIRRGAREAMMAGMNISVIEILDGKDPDECIRKNPKEWREAVKKRRSLMEYYFDKVFNELDITVPENKKLVAQKLLPDIKIIGNKIEQNFWIKKLSEKIDVEEFILRETLENMRSSSGFENKKTAIDNEKVNSTPSSAINHNKILSHEEKISELLIVLLLKFPANIAYAIENNEGDYLSGQEYCSIYRDLMIYYNENGEDLLLTNPEDGASLFYIEFRKWHKEKTKEADNYQSLQNEKILNKIALLGEKDFYDLDDVQAKKETVKIVKLLKKNYLVTKLKELEKLIFEAENKKGDLDKSRNLIELMKEFKLISEELKEATIGEKL